VRHKGLDPATGLGPTLTASSSSLKPQEVIGIEKSQSPLSSEEAAKKKLTEMKNSSWPEHLGQQEYWANHIIINRVVIVAAATT